MKKLNLDDKKTYNTYLNFLNSLNEKTFTELKDDGIFMEAEANKRPKNRSAELIPEPEMTPEELESLRKHRENKLGEMNREDAGIPVKRSRNRRDAILNMKNQSKALGIVKTTEGKTSDTSDSQSSKKNFCKDQWKQYMPMIYYTLYIHKVKHGNSHLSLEEILKLRISNDFQRFFIVKSKYFNPEVLGNANFIDPRLFILVCKKAWEELDELIKDKLTKEWFELLVDESVGRKNEVGGTVLFASFIKTCEEIVDKHHDTTETKENIENYVTV